MKSQAQWNRNNAEGMARKAAYAGSRGYTRRVIDSAILRAMRRGAISNETARQCMDDWIHIRNSRPQSAKWSQYASALLTMVAGFRRRGELSSARYYLDTARKALEARKVALEHERFENSLGTQELLANGGR